MGALKFSLVSQSVSQSKKNIMGVYVNRDLTHSSKSDFKPKPKFFPTFGGFSQSQARLSASPIPIGSRFIRVPNIRIGFIRGFFWLQEVSAILTK